MAHSDEDLVAADRHPLTRVLVAGLTAAVVQLRSGISHAAGAVPWHEHLGRSAPAPLPAGMKTSKPLYAVEWNRGWMVSHPTSSSKSVNLVTTEVVMSFHRPTGSAPRRRGDHAAGGGVISTTATANLNSAREIKVTSHGTPTSLWRDRSSSCPLDLRHVRADLSASGYSGGGVYWLCSPESERL